jgi:heme/copper-type cytochrome/quinol oxidase subunit 1
MVLVAPLSRKAHFVVVLLPFAYGVTRAVAMRSRAAAAWVAPPALVFALTSKAVIGDHAAALALAWGAYTLATLWLWAGAVIVCRRDRRLG